MSDNNFDLIGLIRKNQAAAIASGAALAVATAYLVFFAPLLKELGSKYAECRSCENQVIDARNLVDLGDKIDKEYGGRVLLSEKEAAAGIDEFTKHGKSLGVSFISMKPGEIVAKEGAPYKILPIDMELEANDAQLVKFMGSIDELKKAIVKVKSFDITPTKNDRRTLNAHMVIDLYLSVKE